MKALDYFLLAIVVTLFACIASASEPGVEQETDDTVVSRPVPQQWFSRAEVKKLIMSCGAYNIDVCGDVICEGDSGFEETIHATVSAILLCMQDPSMSREYVSRRKQREVLRAFDLGWWNFE